MNYRTLGKTNLQVSEIGLGTWQLANDPDMWVGGDLNESLKSLARYTELGGNFIDTAWVYGYDGDHPSTPTAESLIGQFLKKSGQRDKLIIASKIAPKNWQWPAFKNIPFTEVFPASHIEKLVDQSLRRMGVDTIDLMQFHVWQDDWAQIDEWKTTTAKLTQNGKVKYWGISVNDYQPSNCLKTLDTGLIATVQCIFNIFHQKPTEKLFPYIKANNIGLIARVPLDEGGLTGHITDQRQFAPGDFRSKYFAGDRVHELTERVDKLKKLIAKSDEVESLTELALRFILSHQEVSTVIPGMRRVKLC